MITNNSQEDAFIESLAGFIDANALLPCGAGVVLAVSGGADSVALLAALNALAEQPGREYRLIVAHLNHLIRPAAAEDAKFVENLARRLSLPCVIGQTDVPALAEQLGQGVEQAGRAARYEFLLKVANDNAAEFVATGHHADDNIETILYRIVRGTAVKGLAGMPVRRPLLEGKQSGDNPPVMLIRPMIELRREEIEAFCRRQNLSWQTDESNMDVTYRRNFIRHDLLDLLRKKLNPRVDEAILRLARTAGEIDEYLTSQADRVLAEATIDAPGDFRDDWQMELTQDTYVGFFAWNGQLAHTESDNFDEPGVDTPVGYIAETPLPQKNELVLNARMLADLPSALRTAVIRLAMERLGVPMRSLGFDRLTDAAAVATSDGPACTDLPGPCRIRRDGGTLIIEFGPAEHVDAAGPAAEQVPLDCPGTAVLPDGATVRCEIVPFDKKTFDAHCRKHPAGVEFLDADQIRGRLICRRRRDGDVFLPLGSPGRQSVSDFLTNTKLSARSRQNIWCICDDLGIICLCSQRIDDRLKVGPDTRRLMRIEFNSAKKSG